LELLLLELQLEKITVVVEANLNEATKGASKTFFINEQHDFIAMHLY
jgi:hypothetical protein